MLAERATDFKLRTRKSIDWTNGVTVSLAGKKYLTFSSNNYLGLAQHPKVVQACQNSLEEFGVGSGSAYLIAGFTSPHQELEEKLAEFLQYPKVLLFSSGYLTNTGVISALFTSKDDIFVDKLSHASLVDGAIASKANLKRYPHCQMEILKAFCQQSCAENKLIVTDGLFGMDGVIAPLDQISVIASQSNAMVLVDDAHAIGILGAKGRGSLEHYGLGVKEIPILVGTLGKAFGSYGAFVASTELIIDSLIQLTRTYLYTTAIPPSLASASLASLRIIQEENWRREKLTDLIHYFRKGASELNIPCTESFTPIQPIMLGSCENTLTVSEKLFSKGIYVKAIRPPTVPKGSSRLRITLTAEHSRSDIDYLLEALSDAIRSC